MKEIVQYTDLTSGEVNLYNELGYLPMPSLVATEALDDLKEEVLTALESSGFTRAELCNGSKTADKLRQCPTYYAGSYLDRLINSPRILKIAGRLVNGKAQRYLPFTAVKSAGGGQFHLHQDNNYTRHEPAMGSLNIWVALVDMTPENGCLQVVPWSHREGCLPSENAGDGDNHRKVVRRFPDAVPLRMRAGDAVAFSRLTVHGSGPNHTDKPRLAYALQYHHEGVRYEDPETKQMCLLTENPRFDTAPRRTVTVTE